MKEIEYVAQRFDTVLERLEEIVDKLEKEQLNREATIIALRALIKEVSK